MKAFPELKDFSEVRAKYSLERVGFGGVRRVCYKIGATGFCVKFYKSPEIFAAQKRRRPRIERECAAKRFDLKHNNSAQEVRVYERYLKTMPPEVTAKLPEIVELVFDPEWGYGILETYYTNPDGTAIIPYEFEIARQTPENREIIYAQAKELLEILAANRAFFFEPGNFHNLIHADGTIETKIVDFEPTSKLFVKLERIWPWWRGWILRAKAKKYLRHIREAYGVKGGR